MVTPAHLNVMFIRTLPVLLLSLFINLTGRFHLRYRSALIALSTHTNSCACDSCLHVRRKQDSVYCLWYRNFTIPRSTVSWLFLFWYDIVSLGNLSPTFRRNVRLSLWRIRGSYWTSEPLKIKLFLSKRREQLALWHGVMSQKKEGFLKRTPLKISKLAEFDWFSAKNGRL